MVRSQVTARDMERAAAAVRVPRGRRVAAPPGEALTMLARRGLQPSVSSPDVPFPPGLDGEVAERLVDLLRHYAFRLFLRGAILRPDGLLPEEATDYVAPSRAEAFADALVDLGLAVRLPRRRIQLARAASNFGGTLEWYIGRELRRWLGFDVATGVKFHARGVGGDLDVVAAAEGKLVYLELKSSPPKHLTDGEVSAFFGRVDLLRPDVTLFAVDTALRLRDKALPMLVDGLARVTGGDPVPPRRIERELWALTPYVFAVNARPDLVGNLGRAIGEGLRALAPPLAPTCGSRV